MSQLSSEEITTRLQPVARALAADGYVLDVAGAEGGRLTARITATADACPECLVPKQVMSGLLAQAIGPDGPAAERIELLYPAETH